MNKRLKAISFSLMGVIILLLVVASITEKLISTEFAVKYFYTAPWTLCLWALTVVFAIAYLIQQKVYKLPVTFFLHFSFVIILAGAMITHIFGKQGSIHLRLNEPAREFALSENTMQTLPFEITLTDFSIDYYPGTQAPMDFVSIVQVADGEQTHQGQISMNHIYEYRHYRFYQAQYDADGEGCVFAVSYDPVGIAVTYIGYACLLLSIIFFFFQRRTHFRSLVRRLTLIALLFLPLSMQAEPKVLQRPLAAHFGNLYLYYNDRVCPMQTLAYDFTAKLYGKTSYKEFTPEQVLTGWFFHYDDWATEPMIKIKGTEVRQALGIEGKYACLNDFYQNGEYKLEKLLRTGNRNAKQADEKFRLISMVATGSIFRIYPLVNEGQVYWLSFTQKPPVFITDEQKQFMLGSMDYVALQIAEGHNKEADNALRKILEYQEKEAGQDNLPAYRRFRAEKRYNSLQYTRPLAMACATLGLLLFFLTCLLIARGKRINQWYNYSLTVLMIILWLFLSYALGLRWFVSGHIPLGNGFETMQFLAWVTALLTAVGSIYFERKRLLQPAAAPLLAQLLLPFGYLLCGMTLMVSMMSAANPQITNLMPVLQSPLLTLHVAIIMVAYCLLAFVMLNGVTALILHKNTEATEKLMTLSQVLLYPAIFCLTIGIFIGAVWANQSWGRYWGWDPKEVWALITMMVYAVMLHTGSLKFLRKPLVFHLYSILAFMAVLFTYFGVNFILGGMHSYA